MLDPTGVISRNICCFQNKLSFIKQINYLIVKPDSKYPPLVTFSSLHFKQIKLKDLPFVVPFIYGFPSKSLYLNLEYSYSGLDLNILCSMKKIRIQIQSKKDSFEL